jgi:hypothetical protein
VSAKIRKRIGEFLILLIYLVIDAFEVWPHSHGWALSAVVVGIVALMLLDGEFSYKSIAAVGTTASIVCAGIYAWAPPTRPDETENHGWLLPANDPSPQTACTPDQSKQGDWFFVTVAGGGVFTAAKNQLAVLTIGDHPTVLMERGPSGLLIDVDMLAENGALVVRIERNEWRAVPAQISYADRPDRNTLVVHDRAGKEIFWLRYMNSNTVKIRGIFHKLGNPTPIVISDDNITLSPDLRLYMPLMPTAVPFVPCLVIATPKFEGPILTIK